METEQQESAEHSVLNNMMKPPSIKPNYGKKKSILPKTNLPKVVLHDNVTQQQILDAKLAHLALEHRRTNRMLDLDKRSFIVQQSLKQQQLRKIGIVVNFLPDAVAEAHLTMSKFRTQKMPKKQLPNLNKKSGLISQLYDSDDLYQNGDNEKSQEAIRENNSLQLGAAMLPGLRSQTAPKWRSKSVNDVKIRREKTFAHSGEHHRTRSGIRDPRFVLLQKSLIPSDRPTDGFLNLSPSGKKVLDQYKWNLLQAKNVIFRKAQRIHSGKLNIRSQSSTRSQSPQDQVKLLSERPILKNNYMDNSKE